jgi:predicted transcriptional regulator of viral defense system
MSTVLGQLETRALAFAQARPGRPLETGDLARGLGWTGEQERKVLSRLARKGLLVRVRRGLYLAPPRLPLGGKWSPGGFLALATLIDDRGGRYQISGPNAFHRYGWTEQIPNRIYAYNNRISGDRQVGPVALTLIKVSDDRLGGTEVVHTPEGLDVVYASRARSLVDAVYDWSRFDSLPRAFGWIQDEISRDDAFAADLVEAAVEFGNQGTIRRIGGALERAGVRQGLLRRLERKLRSTTSLIPWVPSRSKKGTGSQRWGIVFNDE